MLHERTSQTTLVLGAREEMYNTMDRILQDVVRTDYSEEKMFQDYGLEEMTRQLCASLLANAYLIDYHREAVSIIDSEVYKVAKEWFSSVHLQDAAYYLSLGIHASMIAEEKRGL